MSDETKAPMIWTRQLVQRPGKRQQGAWRNFPSGGPYKTAYIRHDRAALLASPIVQEIMRNTFRAGFVMSREAWNGDNPYNGKDPEDDPLWVEERDEAFAYLCAAIRTPDTLGAED
ncbi:hypothetical protein [Tropicimonas sp. IMCC34011]|uniref:hypothetical protein n=1 Tax=Tropicimonas sp. IMCC34011 TaxID=2248759 RepID=UPI000E261DD1|nr:hypothetical protein [Tropicimonas sp. IMCC34011]